MKAKHLLSAILVMVAAVFPGASSVRAREAYFAVTTYTDGEDAKPGDGICATAAGECTLRAAIMEANAQTGAYEIRLPGQTIKLSIPGQNEDNGMTGDLDIKKSMVIRALGPASDYASIDGGGLDRILDISYGTQVELQYVGIVNGKVGGDQDGGGILNRGRLHLFQCAVQSNVVEGQGRGGGIHNSSELWIENSLIHGNSSFLGGGIFNRGPLVAIESSSISGNTVTGEGGGVFNYLGMFKGKQVTIEDNRAVGNYGGGGIYNKVWLDLEDSWVWRNSAGWSGGGITNMGEASLRGTEVDLNTSRGLGGGIYNAGELTITGGTIETNAALLGGGGIENYVGATLILSDAPVSWNAVGDELVQPPGGGGIENGGTASLTNVTLEANTAGYGGGISNSPAGANGVGGELKIVGSTIRSNMVTDTGGGIDNHSGRLSIEGSLIEGNTSAAVGAGLSNWGGNAAITSSKVQGNTAQDNAIGNLGGGIFNYYGPLGVRFTSITGNSADYGGGLYNEGGAVDILFSLMAGNRAAVSGGAVYNPSADLAPVFKGPSSTLYTERSESVRQDLAGIPTFPDELNLAKKFGAVPTADAPTSFIELGVSTLNGNEAPSSGGAIYTSGVMWIAEDTLDDNSSGQGNDLFVDVGGIAAVGSSIMGSPGRKACAGGGSITSYGFNLEFGDTCGFAKAGDRTNTDPLLSPLADNGGPTLTQALALGSPAIDEGSNVWCGAYEGSLPTDQRGQPRTMDGRGDGGAVCDIGAFEVQGPTRSFGDVSESHWAYGYVEAVYEDDYAAGCSADPRLYCPDAGMNRAEGSVFVLRGVHGGGYEPSEPTASFFTDVPLGVWFTKWVQQLWVDGFTAGCSVEPSGDRQFCPYWPHTRAEATVFFLRMLHGPAYEPPEPTTQVYSDVPIGPFAPWYSRWVNAAYEAGITYQCEDVRLRQGGMFHPDAELLRSEGACMMVFAKDLGW